MSSKRYTVTAITGTKQHADTRAKVYITLKGALGATPEQNLAGDFGVGTTRRFPIESPDLGDLQSVTIRHDNTGDAAAWFLDKVLIKDEATGAEWIFRCGAWLSQDGGLSRTLTGELLKPGTVVTPTLSVDWAWGANNWRQADGDAEPIRNKPMTLSHLTDYGVRALASGGWHNLALMENGSMMAWGANNFGQLGDDTTTTPTKAVEVSHLSKLGLRAKAISAGTWQSLALLEDGTVRAWGRNDYGQLGIGSVGIQGAGEVVGLRGVKAISAGGWHGLALLENGEIWAWGYDGNGQLGNAATTSTTSKPVPVKISDFGGVKAKAISAGWRHSLALLEDGTVWSWGQNNFGQLGNGTVSASMDTPVKVLNLSGVKAIAASTNADFDESYSMALLEDGTVWVWGLNNWGQLANRPTVGYSATPERAFDLTGVTAIAAGGWHGLVLLRDGTVRMWGANNWGQLGDGTLITTRDKLVELPELTGIKAIAAGGWHCVAAR
ncbi:PLAT/LH2 domain-containing protein [Polyangium sp. 6x1]|uniref:RCC1 domain-containing protein n=1 Tax=Polyangium sp. 6x1 TaxID=3042689 RepID=UPI002482B4E8|nr:PLAT/LH2 domain-containing protein [Polyangium sp. 6x1]MDI1447998.1 PLAT/LH2 domain-containing protein [Polyangium sp. 6x1]